MSTGEPPAIFVAWDSELKVIPGTFGTIQSYPDDGPLIEILGVHGAVAHDELRTRLKRGVSGATAFLAIVDTPNANMAWELGMALALGLRVAMGTEAEAPKTFRGKPWVQGTPFEAVLREGDLGSSDAARALLSTHTRWLEPKPWRPTGGRTVVVCGDFGTGQDWRRLLAQRGHELFELKHWSPSQLTERLADVDRVAWVVLAQSHDDHRHGAGNATGALVAGCADELGLEVAVFQGPTSPTVADAQHRARTFDGTFNGLERELRSWLEETARKPGASSDPLTTYRTWLRKHHARPLRYLSRLGLSEIDVTPIDLEVTERGEIDRMTAPDEDCRPGKHDHRSGPLRTLVEEDVAAAAAPVRWILKAEPGAGKTTTLRQLAAELALETGPTARVPVFVSLAAWEQTDGGALSFAAKAANLGAVGERALARTAEAGRLWLLLDGFDEVKNHDTMRKRILAEAERHPRAVVLVTSRASQVAGGRAWEGFTPGRLDYLDPARQEALVLGLLGGAAGDAAAFWSASRTQSAVLSLLPNPFLLTLCVGLWLRSREDGSAAPTDRSSLLEQALTDCLARGWGSEDDAAPPDRYDPAAARLVLQALSVVLHELGGETWDEGVVARQLLTLHARFPVVSNVMGADGNTWRSGKVFLDDVRSYAGVFGPLDGKDAPWRYLHRSFRERLVAEFVGQEMEEVERDWFVASLLSAVEKSKGKREARGAARDDDAQRSVELVSMVASVLGGEAGLQVLAQLAPLAADAAVRGLAGLKRVDPWQQLRALIAVPPPQDESWRLVGWDNEGLDQVLDGMVRAEAVERLWEAVSEAAGRFEQGLLWYALERLETRGAGWEEEQRVAAAARFFEAVGLAEVTRPEVGGAGWVSVPAGAFWMGSPEGVGNNVDRPRHRVRLTQPFRLRRAPVTNSAYAPFDEGFRDRVKTRGAHPAVEVSWFEARLYAAWLGGRLPTEAEWEYACRAGADTSFSFGDDDAALGEHAWFAGNSERTTHEVGTKKANPWGLYDMHGQVWEWCEDRFNAYPDGGVIDPLGDPTGPYRVLRGGTFRSVPDFCRSASRFGDQPGVRDGLVGFRVLLPGLAHHPG
jgi:formylglycine-generating enzyme required for sulfatase activity